MRERQRPHECSCCCRGALSMIKLHKCGRAPGRAYKHRPSEDDEESVCVRTMWGNGSALIVLVICACISLDCMNILCRADTVFVLHDAGESYMMQPVIDRMLQADKRHSGGADGAGDDITILTIGEPATSIYATYAEAVTLDGFGIHMDIVDGYDRSQLLSPPDLQRLVQGLGPNTTLVVEGMVYLMQSQVGYALARAYSSYVVGLDDSFALWSEDSISSEAFVEPGRVDEVFLTAEAQAKTVECVAMENGVDVLPTVTGTPTIDDWAAAARDTERVSAARTTLYPAAGPGTVAVVYAGGYGTASYTASLRTFCDVAAALTSGSVLPGEDYAFSFAPHPGYDPMYEQALFREWGCDAIIAIVWETLGLDTSTVVAASNASTSECSTVGGQSLAIGVPHAYVAVAVACVDVFTSTELIPTAPSVAQLTTALTETFRDEGYHIPPYDVVEAGIPLDAIHRIEGRLRDIH